MTNIVQFPSYKHGGTHQANQSVLRNKYPFSADIERAKFHLANTSKRGKHPRDVVREIANCLEDNLYYLQQTGDIATVSETQIEVIAYLRDWISE